MSTNGEASWRRFTQCELVRQSHVGSQATGSTGHVTQVFSIDHVKLFTKETLLFRTFCLGYSWVNIHVFEEGIESWIATALVVDDGAGFDEKLCSRIKEATGRFRT